MKRKFAEAALRAMPYIDEYIKIQENVIDDVTGFYRNSRAPVDLQEHFNQIWDKQEKIRRLRYLRLIMREFVRRTDEGGREFLRMRYIKRLTHENIAQKTNHSRGWSERKGDKLLRSFGFAMLCAGIDEARFARWFSDDHMIKELLKSR